ncbi:MAG TPA: nucleotide exchange factor GrpE [Gemmataceae bacterium]|nr:nucleotide exchange factor GrpE [Gemmataceae bacterium]
MADDQNTAEADAPQMLTDAQERLAASERQLEDTVALLKQTQADFENYQKRAAREWDSERKYAASPLARDLLPALDNLQRAMDAAKQVGESGPLVQGVAATQAQIIQILGRHGITPIEAQDQPFDPNKHEAVMQKPSADHPPGTVVQVLQSGFMIHDRVLRPASVVVSSGKG